MSQSHFRKIYPLVWYCGPSSHLYFPNRDQTIIANLPKCTKCINVKETLKEMQILCGYKKVCNLVYTNEI